MSKLQNLILSVCALLALAVPASFAQAPGDPSSPEAPPSFFGEPVDVRVVNVEVVVTDKQGNRVSGLQTGDLRLLVDGKEVPIEYFTEIRSGQAITGPSEESAVPGLPGLAPGSPVGTSYLVFIDDLFSIQAQRNEVLRMLKDDLSRMNPEDRMAIVAFDGRDLKMLTSWTSSQRDLSRALDNASMRRSYGIQQLSDLRLFERSRQQGMNAGFGPRSAFQDRLDFEERDYAERLTNQIRNVVSATVSTLRGFAAPPGRKVMLLLSGGWPANPSEYVVNNPVRQVFQSDLPQNDKLLEPITDTANRLGYTIYPVDVPGVQLEAIDADGVAPALTAVRPSNVFREQEVHATLQFVAEETGGRPLINALRSEAFEAVADDTRSYYWIGFTPQWQGNDKRHDVKVEPKLAGLSVRSRDSFLDLSRRAETSMMVESAMLFGSGPDSATLPVKLGAVTLTGRKEMELPVTLAIPTEGFTAVPLDGKYVAELELRIAAMDDKGNRSDIPVIPIRFALDQAPPAGKFVPYSTKLKLRRQPHHIVVAVFDPQSNKILTAQADAAPPSKK